MASQIKIAGRRDLLILSDEKARQLKRQWLDEKISRETRVDLGNWTGKLGRIDDIYTEPEQTFGKFEDTSAESRISKAEWATYSLKRKTEYGCEWASFIIAGRNFKETSSGRTRKDLSEKEKHELEKILLTFYTTHPHEPLCPPSLFEHLLPGYIPPTKKAQAVVG